MNSSNTGQQLRYLEEVCISLHGPVKIYAQIYLQAPAE